MNSWNKHELQLLRKQHSNGYDANISSRYAIPELLRSAAMTTAKMSSGNNASMSAETHDSGVTNGIIRSYASHSVGAKPTAAVLCNTTYLSVDEQYRYNQVLGRCIRSCERPAPTANAASY